MQTVNIFTDEPEPDAAPMSLNPFERCWVDLPLPLSTTAMAYNSQLQAQVDSRILALLRSGDRRAAQAMVDISLGLLAQHRDLLPRVFWQIGAAYFEAVALGLIQVEFASKKVLTAIVLQYRALAAGASTVSESLLSDLLMLIERAASVPEADAPVLSAVQRAYGRSEVNLLESEQEAVGAGEAAQGAAACARSGLEDQFKVIGTLRIDIAAFNSYLNEADEWSRRLLVELSEWALELHQPVSEDSIALARALATSSERIGLGAVTQMANALAQALHNVRTSGPGRAQQASQMIEAADDIRRLLHQFAAGFLKSPEPKLLEQLVSLAQFDPSAVPEAPPMELDFDLSSDFVRSAPATLLQLGGALRQWSARPDNVGARNEALRVLQSLKQGAQLAGVTSVYELGCGLELSIEQLGMQALQVEQLAPLLAGFDALCAHLGQLQAAQA